jgi:hypothetical protein
VYNIADRASFTALDEIFLEVDSVRNSDFPLVLIGNKCDLAEQREVSEQEGKELAMRFGCPFFETSARTAINVHEAFCQLVREIRRHYQENDLNETSKKDKKQKGQRVIPPLVLPAINEAARHAVMTSDFNYTYTRHILPAYADLYITSDRVLKYQLFLYLGPVLFACPSDVMNLIRHFLLRLQYFKQQDYFSYPVHRCILFTNCAGLMDRISEKATHCYVPQACQSVVQYTINWMYNLDSVTLRHRLTTMEQQQACRHLATHLNVHHQLVSVLQPIDNVLAPALSFALLFDSAAFSDYSLTCEGGKRILLHRAILAARGGCFLRDYAANPPHRSHYDAYYAVFRYMYCDEIALETFPLELVKQAFHLFVIFNACSTELFALFQHRFMQLINYSNCVSLLLWSKAPSASYYRRAYRYISTWVGYRVAMMENLPEWQLLSANEREAVLEVRRNGTWVEAKPHEKAHENCSVS